MLVDDLQVGPDRHLIGLLRLVAGLDLKPRLILFVRILDHKPDLARDLIHFLLDRFAFLEVLKLYGSRNFGKDRVGERIPRREHVVFLHLLAVLNVKLGAVYDLVPGNLTPALVHKSELGRLPPHRDHFLLTVLDDVPIADELHGAVHRGFVLGLLFETGRTTDVERTHR